MAEYQADAFGGPIDIGSSSALRRPFDPAAHDLDSSFRLTRFADLKGRGCKVPQDVLNKLVSSLQQDYTQEHDQFMISVPRIGIGLDCSVTPLRHGKFPSSVRYIVCVYFYTNTHTQSMPVILNEVMNKV